MHGAHTPEELEALLEDAFIVRDVEALAQLFDEGAVLVPGARPEVARGGAEIARLATAMWERERTYVAGTRRVLQARDTALGVGGGISVMRRGGDRAWRYAIALMDFPPSAKEEA